MFSRVLNKPRAREDVLWGSGGREQVSTQVVRPPGTLALAQFAAHKTQEEAQFRALLVHRLPMLPPYVLDTQVGRRQERMHGMQSAYPGASCNSPQYRETCLRVPAISRQSLLLSNARNPSSSQTWFYLFSLFSHIKGQYTMET